MAQTRKDTGWKVFRRFAGERALDALLVALIQAHGNR